jgi:hypothetical protein
MLLDRNLRLGSCRLNTADIDFICGLNQRRVMTFGIQLDEVGSRLTLIDSANNADLSLKPSPGASGTTKAIVSVLPGI